MNLDLIMQVARQAVSQAGEVLQGHFAAGVETRSKPSQTGGGHNLVSDADLESETLIAQIIRSTFPDHELLGEEQLDGAADGEHLWVIDPLDGTNNFAHGIPHFAVSIAYCYRGQPQVGVVYNPIREDWYTAIKGQGAWQGDRRLHVSGESTLSDGMFGCGFHYDRGAMMRATLDVIGELFAEHQIHGIRRMGTAALDCCGVATGQFAGFFEYYLSPWDFAAGWLIVQESGGKLTTTRGEPVSLTGGGLVVTNGKVHDDLSRIVTTHMPDGF